MLHRPSLTAAGLLVAALLAAGTPAHAEPVSYVGGASGFQAGGKLSFSFTGDFINLGADAQVTNFGFPASTGGINGAGSLSAFSLVFTGSNAIPAFSIDLAEASGGFQAFGVLDYPAFANGPGTPSIGDDPDFVLGIEDQQTGTLLQIALVSNAALDTFLNGNGFTVRGVRLSAPIGGNEFVTNFSSNAFIDPVGNAGPGTVPEPAGMLLAMTGLAGLFFTRRRQRPAPAR